MKVLKIWWVNYEIKRCLRYISNMELNIYFDGYTGQMCIEAIDYELNKIEYLKSLL